MKKYYDLLGVNEDADDYTVKKAYRTLINKYKANVSKINDIKIAYKKIMNSRLEPIYDYSSIEKNINNMKDGKEKYSSIVDMIMDSKFTEAVKTLINIQDKDEKWHYLYATANYGVGNNVNAAKHLKYAYEMAEDKNMYNQMYDRDNQYNNRVNNGRYSNDSCLGTICCCDTCCSDSCCDACCKLYCADSLCECMGGDLCECF